MGVLLLGGMARAEVCRDSFLIDSVAYAVTDRWCGQAIDSARLAKPGDLVRLPDELTFEDYNIYILPETRRALISMAEEAGKSGVLLIADSGFRSVSYQKRIIRSRMEDGETVEKILMFVAPPGYSEHHTGRAVDFCPSEARFAHTEAYRWLKQNAADFGFFETYPEISTGAIPWESSHWYYRGTQ
jgi:LAS superfamily LD-carboxypeptidase LdcB